MRFVFVLVLATLPLLASCSTQWMAPTDFSFRGLRTGEERLIEDVFTDQNLVYEKVEGPGITYRVRGIDTTNHLGSVHRAIRETIRKNDLQLRLESARIFYSGIAIQSQIEVKVLVEVTGGARAWIADGSSSEPWREIDVKRSGRWYDTVDTTQTVSDENGYLYIYSRAGEVARAQRMQVLTRRTEDIPLDALPFRPPSR